MVIRPCKHHLPLVCPPSQVVAYFNLVHAAQTAAPPADLHQQAIDGGREENPDVGNSQHVSDKGVREAIERKSVEIWRRKLLRQMLRSELGFSTFVKDSTIPGAGLGLYIEGSAPAGAVVAIYPVRPMSPQSPHVAA